MTTLDNYLDIKTIVERYPQFSENQLRWMVKNKQRYGISHLIKKVSRKIYFDVTGLAEWIDSRG